MEILELINKIKDTKEKGEICDEIIKIYEYKIFIMKTNSITDEINKFIIDVINKYRNKIEVIDFYQSSDGDKVFNNAFDNLCMIEKMVYNYVLRKILLEYKNNN